MSKNFGNQDPWDQTEAAQVARPAPNDTATGFFRDWAAAIFWLGVIGLVPPFTAGGVIAMVVGAVFWTLSPVVQMNENATMAETKRTGNGCGPFLVTCAVMICVGVIVLALGAGAIDAMIAAGMVQP